MNTVHIYDWNDAPNSLRDECRSLIPAGYDPCWLAYAEQHSKSPTYVLAFASSAWISAMADEWHKVFLRELADGGEVRVGCSKAMKKKHHERPEAGGQLDARRLQAKLPPTEGIDHE